MCGWPKEVNEERKGVGGRCGQKLRVGKRVGGRVSSNFKHHLLFEFFGRSSEPEFHSLSHPGISVETIIIVNFMGEPDMFPRVSIM